jgi:hypothetical protein
MSANLCSSDLSYGTATTKAFRTGDLDRLHIATSYCNGLALSYHNLRRINMMAQRNDLGALQV